MDKQPTPASVEENKKANDILNKHLVYGQETFLNHRQEIILAMRDYSSQQLEAHPLETFRNLNEKCNELSRQLEGKERECESKNREIKELADYLSDSQEMHRTDAEKCINQISQLQSQLLQKETEGLLFRVTAKNQMPDPTIFFIKSVEENKVIVSWQDIHGRGERTTEYVLSDVKSKFKFGDWTEVNPMEEISQLQTKCEYLKARCEAAEVLINEKDAEKYAGDHFTEWQALKSQNPDFLT